MDKYEKILEEAFGEPIGSYAGDAPVGVRNEISSEVCPDCGMMHIDNSCGCDHSDKQDDGEICPDCGMQIMDGSCGCEEYEEEPIKLSIVDPVKLDPVTIKIDLGDALGADAEDESACPECGMMVIDGKCGCEQNDEVCPDCGMMPVDGSCGCNMSESKKGPSAKTARKILRGTKSFKQKMKKVSSWADDPAAAAAWMTHKAYGKWPSEKE